MHILKGKGSTFSTSKQRWNPFRINRKVAAQNAKRHRILKAGLTITPAEAAMLTAEAIANGRITHVVAGKRTLRRSRD